MWHLDGYSIHHPAAAPPAGKGNLDRAVSRRLEKGLWRFSHGLWFGMCCSDASGPVPDQPTHHFLTPTSTVDSWSAASLRPDTVFEDELSNQKTRSEQDQMREDSPDSKPLVYSWAYQSQLWRCAPHPEIGRYSPIILGHLQVATRTFFRRSTSLEVSMSTGCGLDAYYRHICRILHLAAPDFNLWALKWARHWASYIVATPQHCVASSNSSAEMPKPSDKARRRCADCGFELAAAARRDEESTAAQTTPRAAWHTEKGVFRSGTKASKPWLGDVQRIVVFGSQCHPAPVFRNSTWTTWWVPETQVVSIFLLLWLRSKRCLAFAHGDRWVVRPPWC